MKDHVRCLHPNLLQADGRRIFETVGDRLSACLKLVVLRSCRSGEMTTQVRSMLNVK